MNNGKLIEELAIVELEQRVEFGCCGGGGNGGGGGTPPDTCPGKCSPVEEPLQDQH